MPKLDKQQKTILRQLKKSLLAKQPCFIWYLPSISINTHQKSNIASQSSTYILDYNLYSNFRSRINQDNFIPFKYNNVDGKDLYSCICSSIDWISVGLDFINGFKDLPGTLNARTVNIYMYISCIDMIVESINQLNRVLFSIKDSLFNDEKDCFFHKPKIFEDMTDNMYFKEIRSHFGAHPTNLGKDTNKRYASWPTQGGIQNCDYSVHVYNLKYDIEYKNRQFVLELYISELNKFVLKRYNYLECLTLKIDDIYRDFCKQMSITEIQKCDDVKKQIEILIDESKKRFNRDDYICILKECKSIFEMNTNNINSNILKKFKEYLQTIIEKIYSNLQEMQLDKELSYCIYSPPMPKEIQDSFRCLFDAKFSNKLLVLQDPIEKYLKGVIKFDTTTSIDERYILTLAGIFYKMQTESVC